jgi:hypothetical protein
MNGSTSEIYLITPTLAAEWLESGIGKINRSLSSALIRRYAGEMLAGRWIGDNGQSITFDAEGVLRDGQHRLQAIIESGVTIRMRVTKGVSSDAFTTIDCGKSRSIGDIFHIAGVSSGSRVGTIVGYVMQWESLGAPTGQGVPPATARLARYKQDPARFDDLGRYCERLIHAGVTMGSMLAAARYMVENAVEDTEIVAGFFEPMIGGEDLTAGSPILTLRNRLVAARGKREQPITMAALIVRGWNAWISGRTVKTLVSAGEFPAIRSR